MIASPPRLAPRVQPSGFSLDGGDALTIFIPATFFVYGHFVGQLYLPEILLASILPALVLAHARSPQIVVPRTFLALGLLWFYGQIATDVYRATSLHNLARGWANIAFTLIDFLALALLLRNNTKRYALFALGLSVGMMLDFLINRDDQGYPWKFGVAVPIAIALVLVATTGAVRRVPFLSGVVLAVGALLNLSHDYRSLALILFVAALYLFYADGVQRRDVAVGTLLRLTTVSVVGAFVFDLLYSRLARSGALGASAQQKYDVQTQNAYGLIGGGRPEFRASLHAILDSPLLGHGSWPVDPKYLKYLQVPGLHVNPDLNGGLIPAHSYLTGAWVSAGVLGVPIWIWTFALACRALVRGLAANDRFLPLVAFSAFSLCWAIPFSPYAGNNRLPTLFYVLVLLLCLERIRSSVRTT